MANSKSLLISAPARLDLINIGDYTQRTWGTSQKTKYLKALKTAFKALRDTPAIGATRDDISPNLRALTIGKHIIFYRYTDHDAVEIIRVLHHAMDVAQQIPDHSP